MRLKINKTINIFEENEQKKEIPIMKAKILGRVSFGTFRKYIISNDAAKFWLKQEKDQWSLWVLWKEEKEIILSKDDKGKIEKTNGHPLNWIITMVEGDTSGKGKNRKIITERRTSAVKSVDGDVEKIRPGAEMEYINGKFYNQPNYQWPLFSLEMWEHLGWEKQYYSGIKVNVAIAN